MEIKIHKDLKEKSPRLMLGCILADITYKEHDELLWNRIEDFCDAFEKDHDVKEIATFYNVDASRKAYRACGKDPARYRLSSESLLRRVLKGKGLYKVNNIVDINNYLSLKYHYSIGTYDTQTLKEPIEFRIGLKDEPYAGIGRGDLNVENLPILADQESGFGSSTSDSERTMIRENTKRILMNIISFGGESDLEEAMEEAVEMLKEFAEAQNVTTFHVE